MKTGIIVCTNSGLDYTDYNKENIKIMRSILNIANEEYNDYIDITADKFYEMIASDRNMKISTSQCPIGIMVEMLEDYKDKGFTDVIVITISTKLSGSLSTMGSASKMVDGINVHLFDSKTVSYAEVYMTNVASKMAIEGKTPNEILTVLDQIRDNNYIYVCVDTLHYLMLNGRISVAKAMIGTLLKMKPLLYFDKEGSLTTLEKIRTKNKAKDRMVEIVLEQIKNKKIILYAAYTDNFEETKEIVDSIVSLTNSDIIDVQLVPLTPVVGCHAGPKTCGVGFIIL